jgi:DNA replication regulator DPB11
MGATIKLDLTSDVTHLIVGNTESAKYRYVAKSREDVKVLAPSWLEALREVWMEGGDDLNLVALETEHRLPTFFGLKICLTGFDNRTRTIVQDEYVLTWRSGTKKIHTGDG